MRKFGWSRSEVDDAFGFYLSSAIRVEVSGKIQGICRDPKDDMVLECAAVSGAEIIVSGDKDLLVLKNYQGIRVVTPRGFLGSSMILPETL
jgi:predicted nucleic acid-binding protein